MHRDLHTIKPTNNVDVNYISKTQATDILNKLPETIELGIFKLPFGNCFECEAVED